jgi:hypothetical protein
LAAQHGYISVATELSGVFTPPFLTVPCRFQYSMSFISAIDVSKTGKAVHAGGISSCVECRNCRSF